MALRREIGRQRAELADTPSVERTTQQAQKLESVGRLAGGVAHDFNNLLTVICGYASLISEDSETSPHVRARVDEILRASARAKELTDKLLILSRRHPNEPRPIDVDDFVRQEARMMPRLIGEHITIVLRLGTAASFVRIDPAQLTQILLNLVLNARDVMPDGGTLTLATSLETVDAPRPTFQSGSHPGEYVRISVGDTGPGIDRDAQAHLFEPFFTTKAPGKGTGLGLATVFGLVQQAGGFLEVETGHGSGTTMTVFLPQAPSGVATESPGIADHIRGGDEVILVVEDDPSVRMMTCTVLAGFGYRIVQSDGPQGALQLMRDGLRPDLIVTDVVMPAMNGRRMIGELQRLASDFEVLYASGFADAGLPGTTELHAEPARFLGKPFTPAALASKVRDLLDARGINSPLRHEQ
jgi:two-component system cell cycle sensor histidine kinase/response regulator CckA